MTRLVCLALLLATFAGWGCSASVAPVVINVGEPEKLETSEDGQKTVVTHRNGKTTQIHTKR
jgi:hypothetical protein